MQSILKFCDDEDDYEFVLAELINHIDFTKFTNDTLKQICNCNDLIRKYMKEEVKEILHSPEFVITSIVQKITDLMDFSKLDNEFLKKSIHPSKTNIIFILNIININDIPIKNMINTIKNVIFKRCHKISFDNFKSIDFDGFSQDLLRACVTMSILFDIDIDKFCFILNKLKFINYGDSLDGINEYPDINPLISAAQLGNLNMIKILVENYNADINYKSSKGLTAVTIVAHSNCKKITNYLLDIQKKREKIIDLNKIHEKFKIVQQNIDGLEKDLKEFDIKYQ